MCERERLRHSPVASFFILKGSGVQHASQGCQRRQDHSIARFWLARCALAPTIFFSRFVHMVHGMRRCAVHIARHGQHAHCAQRASGYKFCCYAQYACRKYYSQRTRCLHIACHVHQLARAQQWHVPRNGKPVQEPRNMH